MVKGKTLREQITFILKEYPKSRDDDFFLYFMYIKEFYPGIDSKNPDMKTFLKGMSEGEIPSIFSVSRERRKVQSQAAESEEAFLCGNRALKKAQEQQYREYYKH